VSDTTINADATQILGGGEAKMSTSCSATFKR